MENQKDDTTLNLGALLDELVQEALKLKASDIHMEPREEDMAVRFRIDGMLKDMKTFPKDTERALVFKVKVSSHLRTDEHFAPQDGRIGFTFGDTKLDTRVSIVPTTHGEKIVMRLLSKQGRAITLENLGIDQALLDTVKKNYTKPYGTILAVGPTGCGKTTTLYAILELINSREKNISTIEDPVEYDIEGVNHIQVNPRANLTFATGLRALLRQDPNIIMIGEIRDAETASIAINAAMTGHLVLSTLHTNDSVTTIPRLIQMGIEPYLVANTVTLIMAQRLARKLCDKCKKAITINEAKIKEIEKFRPDISSLLKVGQKIWEEAGCAECGNSGFKGRVGIFEILELNKNVRNAILENRDTDTLFERARKEGLVILLEDAMKKLSSGSTSLSEILRVTAIRE